MSYNFTWPVEGSTRISSYFGPRDNSSLPAGASSYHEAIDISAPKGAGVLAALPGSIKSTGYSSGKGNYIIIDHGSGVLSEYNHLDTIGAAAGQSVAAGQKIGTVGSSGISTGPHLDFRIKVNGSYIDPLLYEGPGRVPFSPGWILAGLLLLVLIK